MLKNYFTIAIRNLLRHKSYSAISIFGLAVGIAFSILILVLIQHEWSFDKFHENGGRIYRLINKAVDQDRFSTLNHPDIADALNKEIPGITRSAELIHSNAWIKYNNKIFEEEFLEVQPDFLQMFSFPLIIGNAASVLQRPDAVIISERLAQKYFGISGESYDTIAGEVLEFDGEHKFAITGVFENVPANSSLQFDLIIRREHWQNFSVRYADGAIYSVYVQLDDGVSPAAVEAAFPGFVQSHFQEQLDKIKARTQAADTQKLLQLRLQPLRDVYRNQEIRNGYEAQSASTSLSILAGITLLILVIACINFMTLSVGRSTTRRVEVGMRKVMGARRTQLMRQFWGEAFLIGAIALMLGVCLAELFLPTFNHLTQKDLILRYFTNPQMLAGFAMIMTVVGLVAGSYPAVALSAFNPAAIFRWEFRLSGKSRMTRLLVVLQYALSIGLIICTTVMVRQLHYMRTKNVGFDRELVCIVQVTPENDDEVKERFMNKVSSYHNIESISASDRGFPDGRASMGLNKDGGERFDCRFIRVDHDFFQTLELKIIMGRNFSPQVTSDTISSIIVNETFVRTMGWQDEVIGKVLRGGSTLRGEPLVVIGVVKDFHFDSMYDRVQPLALHMGPRFSHWKIFARIKPRDVSGTISFLEKTWHEIVPDRPFTYSFLDESIASQYRPEERWSKIVGYAAGFAIFISCLGLLGLASLAVARRTKEVGIRKVLGASVANLVGLLSRDFMLMLLVANALAWPLAYQAMVTWLGNFAYRVDLTWWMFALAGAGAAIAALLTVSTQAIKAALANPVEALRYE